MMNVSVTRDGTPWQPQYLLGIDGARNMHRLRTLLQGVRSRRDDPDGGR
ncbi:MAG: hypothetical protein FD149_428 [Rhodospirillaceae bacterium]|nr:MAG: hypothetical protein FD149_428 [Rhodospirillaceae bacterium]